MRSKIVIVFLLILVVAGCSDNQLSSKNKEIDEEELTYATLRINMPMNFDDLDEIFEIPMEDYMYKNSIGVISGDGFPIDEMGPYATDIDFDIKLNKIDEFDDMIYSYKYPRGSYLEINGNIKTLEGKLLGLRLTFDNLDNDLIESIYLDLSNKMSSYVYKSLCNFNEENIIYYYGEDLNVMKSEIDDYIIDNGYSSNIIINEMPTFFKEI